MQKIDSFRFEQLERQVQRLRRLVIVMALAFAGLLTLGATSQPNELTLRRLVIVDAAGRERIVAGAVSETDVRLDHFDETGKKRVSTWTNHGGAGSSHYDAVGTRRVFTETRENGWALTANVDRHGIPRVSTSTYIDDAAGTEYLDPQGKQRIVLRTRADSRAAVSLLDAQQKERIVETTFPDGSATFEISEQSGRSTFIQRAQ